MDHILNSFSRVKIGTIVWIWVGVGIHKLNAIKAKFGQLLDHLIKRNGLF